MTRHLAKALDAIWYISMGLFLGLTGGLVLSVILTFRGAREIDATPGVEPFSDPRFAEYHNDAVAGYIGQALFAVGGTAAIILLMIAVIARIGYSERARRVARVGSRRASVIRFVALVICFASFAYGGTIADKMNSDWPDIYDPETSEAELVTRREAFEENHQASERVIRISWLSGFLALAISPWCRRIADVPLQSGDGKEEEVNQKEDGAQEA